MHRPKANYRAFMTKFNHADNKEAYPQKQTFLNHNQTNKKYNSTWNVFNKKPTNRKRFR